MPEKLPSQQPSGMAQSRNPRSRPASPSRNEESSPGGKHRIHALQIGIHVREINKFASFVEGSARRRLQKHASTTTLLSDTSSHSAKSTSGTRIGIMGKRRLSIRDQKAPQGPRPQDPSRRRYRLPIPTFPHPPFSPFMISPPPIRLLTHVELLVINPARSFTPAILLSIRPKAAFVRQA